ncbi:MAG: hypothetical protein A4E58_03354 [Syntrophorhabdus sp. PtaB.Bin006]|nr:MAG: hypothetical protein A4E58_03354 [Syntrophorhabdus sp. PtaB.Bin006]
MQVGTRLTFLLLLTICSLLLVFSDFHISEKGFASPVFASDEPFTGPANWGGTGLMEIPSARVMKKDNYRIGAASVEPYRYYYGAMSPLKGLEFDGRITEVSGVKALSVAYGNLKDKAFDVKYQFLEESKWLPAMAIGIMDPQGTRKYPAQYIVASKQIYPFDFTIGFGNGRFGKKPLPASDESVKAEIFTDPKGWLKDSQIFGGVQFSPSEKYSFMVEYSPIKFHKQIYDPAQARYFQKPVRSAFNFGMRWKPFRWAEIGASYQRGEQFGINFSTVFEIGRPLIPIYDRPYKEEAAGKDHPLEERLGTALFVSGFSDIRIIIDGSDIRIEAQNNRYFYVTKSVGIILKLVMEIVPPNVENIHIVLSDDGFPLIAFSTTRMDTADWLAEKLTTPEFLYLSKLDTTTTGGLDAAVQHERRFTYGLRPSLESFVNDPSGFYKYRFGVATWASYHPWKGASFVVGPEWYLLNNISSSNVPGPEAVRSDIVLYKGKNVTLGRLMFSQWSKMEHEVYGRFGAGYLEVEYAGLDGELAKPFFGGRVMVGVSGSVVRKRDPDNVFRLSDTYKDVYKTAFLNTRLNIPEQNIAIDIKAGRFLAGDKGARITVSKFINGVILSAWYGVTDTSVFKDPYNRGYHDKGIALVFPIRLFKGADSKTSYRYAISPWTRDVGQDIDHYETLFDYIGRNVRAFFEKDAKQMR